MTDPERPSTDDVLRRGLVGDGEVRRLTLDADFQGLPDTAHGGSVLAAFDAMAGTAVERSVNGVYRRRVPLDTPLELVIRRDGTTTFCRLLDAGALLVEGSVAPAAAAAAVGGGPLTNPSPANVDVAARVDGNTVTHDLAESPGGSKGPPPAPAAADGTALPISRTCFACGTENRLGLRLRLAMDDHVVRGTWTPRETLRAADGTLAPVALTTLLDEAAFWLGAAASGESGMTTDLRVTLHVAVPFGRPLTVAGARARVRARADDPRYWETEVGLWDETGTAVASARITFVAVRGAARKLVTGLLAVNPLDALRRVFPAYAR